MLTVLLFGMTASDSVTEAVAPDVLWSVTAADHSDWLA